MAVVKTISTGNAEADNGGCCEPKQGVRLTGRRSETPGAELTRFAPAPNGNPAAEIPESVNAAHRRLVLDAPSLLPRCDMPVARMLFAEWWAKQKRGATGL